MATSNNSILRVAALSGLMLSLTAGQARADDRLVPTLHEASAPRKTRKRHLRMTAELAAILAVGHRWYWRDGGSANIVDWQLPQGAAAIEAKLTTTDGWRFDGNPYDINALCHPGFGMLTHFLARENGYGLGESFLISSFASGAWEVFFEVREYGSLNDLAITSTAGIPLGESAYQIIHHLRETDFELRSGVGTENGATFAVFSASAELDRIPSTGSGSFRGGRDVSFSLEMPTDEQGARSYSLGATSTVGGWYRNSDRSRLVGALSTEFNYKNQAERPEREWDLLTSVGMGPSVDYRMHRRGLTVDVGTALYLDFGMLKSQAFEAWRTDHPQAAMRNVMSEREHPYYFAFGASVTPRIKVAYGNYFAGARVSSSLFSSIDSADRDQEMLTAPVHFTDLDTTAEASLGFEHRGISLVANGRIHRRSGTAGDAHDSTGERTAMLTLGFRR